MNNLESKIEAILFFKGEPVSLKKLSNLLSVETEEIKGAILNLKESLKNRGIVLLEKEDEVTLGVSLEHSKMIDYLQKEELNKDLSRASLETLSIILYKNGVSKGEIDYIRGVNSSFTLRALLIRGLIEKSVDSKDNRKYIYSPSFDLLSYMGVKSLNELPMYEDINKNISQEIKSLNENTEE